MRSASPLVWERPGQEAVQASISNRKQRGLQAPQARRRGTSPSGFWQVTNALTCDGFSQPSRHGVVRLCLLGIAREHVDDPDVSARRADTNHLGEHGLWLQEVVGNEYRVTTTEKDASLKWQRPPPSPICHVTFVSACDSLPGRRLFDHRRRQIDPGGGVTSDLG